MKLAPWQLIRRTVSQHKAIATVLLLTVAAVIVFGIYLWSRTPEVVWLPDSAKLSADDAALYGLPVQVDAAVTRYGRALRFGTSTQLPHANPADAPWAVMYAYRANRLLRPSECPNIERHESLLPSACKLIGKFQGSPVYSIQRSLPDGSTELFMTIDDTFMFIRTGGDGEQSLGYLRPYHPVARGRIAAYLAETSRRIDGIVARRQAAKATADRLGALAYTKLGFTPVLPGVVPPGWKAVGAGAGTIQIDGADAAHPRQINTAYVRTGAASQTIAWHVGKLSEFQVGASCGPSPGYSMESLACHQVAGTGYYEATTYDQRNDFVRYLYYPVADSLVITHIVVNSTDGTPANPPAGLLGAQDELTRSAAAVDVNRLAGSSFYRLYY